MPFIVPDKVREPLYAIVPVFNPWRWKTRWKHAERALKHFHQSGAVIYLVEIAFGRREFAFADLGLDGTPSECKVTGSQTPDKHLRHKYIGLRTSDELWLKECAVNRAAQELPFGWQQLCMLDGDVQFVRPNWVGECIHKLQHYDVLQMFSHARDVGPNYEMLSEDYPHANGVGFVQSWKDGDLAQNLSFGRKAVAPVPPVIKQDVDVLRTEAAQIAASIEKLAVDLEPNYYGGDGPRRVFPGLAWAFTRKAFDGMGGLIDVAIWGGGDWHMAHALAGRTEGMMHSKLHPNYKTIITEWMSKADKHVRGNTGVMEGSILHHWHGRKTVRGYGDKHRILARVGFDPLRHLKRDYQGLYQLHDDGTQSFVELRDEMRRIAHERNEDSPEL